MKEKMIVNGLEISVKGKNAVTYISLTDIAKLKNPSDPRFVVKNWMRSKETIALLGLWEILNNPDFNRVEFDTVSEKEAENIKAKLEIALLDAEIEQGQPEKFFVDGERFIAIKSQNWLLGSHTEEHRSEGNHQTQASLYKEALSDASQLTADQFDARAWANICKIQ